MKLRKALAFLLASVTTLCVASCDGDDDDDDAPITVVKTSAADAVVGMYVDSLSYTVGTMSDGVIQNDTLTICKVSDNMVDLHFSQYMGMGGSSSSLNVYNVVVTEKDGSYTLSVSEDEDAATKAKMTSSAYNVTKLDGVVGKESVSIDFDFLIAAMNATFSNSFKNGKKVSK